MVNPTPDALRKSMAAFVRYRKEHLSGDEKGEAQIFLDRLFRAFGHEGVREAGATLEMRIKKRDQKGTAFADLMWKPRCLIEMKKSGTNLARHYRQAFDYWVQAVPDRPRYVLLSNFDEIWVYDFDVQLDEPMDRVRVEDIPTRWESLSFLLPRSERPVFRNDLVAVTREAAARVAKVFTGLHERGISRNRAQKFTLQSVMAMFAEDIGLLPSHLFTRALEDSRDGESAYDLLFGLFREMNSVGKTPAGRYAGTPYFNGGLFEDVEPFELTVSELESLYEACLTDWSAVRPEIFGTLFEQSMDAGERHAYGAHFTSQADIVRIVGPTIVTPWRERIDDASTIGHYESLLDELFRFRVLDPACGSGNFLYVAYRELRRIENEIQNRIDERRRDQRTAAQRSIAYVHTDHFLGIDRNAFAVEVAKVTMMLAKKLSADEFDNNEEVLPLDNLDDSIFAGDALFTPWPKADAIIGNPPYLGRRRMAEELGSDYCQSLAQKYPLVGGVSDYVCYWFPIAHENLPEGGRAGLVATNSVRENESREASLDYVVDHGGVIVDAVSSQAWSGDAVVHVSLINWVKGTAPGTKTLWLNDGQLRLEVDNIPSSLSPDVDVRRAVPLEVNQKPAICFQGQTTGITKGYVLNRDQRREILSRDPDSRRVIHPFLGGRELLRDIVINRWVIDAPYEDIQELNASAPGASDYLHRHVLPERERLLAREELRNAQGLAKNPKHKVESQHRLFMNRWWQHWRRRQEMLDAIGGMERYLATSRHAAAHRLPVFSFVDSGIRPGDALTVFALDDEYSFGVLSSKLHHLWFAARCSRIKGDPRYTSTTVWDTFPWPQAPADGDVRMISEIAAEILIMRNKYLQQNLSLAKQYDTFSSPGRNGLRDLHEQLDAAVIDAYGFTGDEDYLSQLLALNQSVAGDPGSAQGPGPRQFSGVRKTDFKILPPIG